MEYRHHKDFMSSVRDLYQKGGLFQKAALQVRAILGGIGVPDTYPFAGFRQTKHGENRVSKCLKYDLIGFARLITITEKDVTLFCFAGDHTACDAWLERNRGLTLAADEHGRMVDVQRTPRGLGIESALTGPSALTKGKLYEGLTPETYFDRLVQGLPRQLVRKLEELESINEESDIYEITKAIDDIDRAQAIYDVFSLLRQDKRRQAIDRAKLFLGETREIVELTKDEIRRLADSETIKTIRADDPRFQRVFEHFVKSAS